MLRISQGFCFQNLIIRDQYKREKYSSYSDYVLLPTRNFYVCETRHGHLSEQVSCLVVWSPCALCGYGYDVWELVLMTFNRLITLLQHSDNE